MLTKIKWSVIFPIIGLFIILYNPPLFAFNSMHIVGLISIMYLLVNKCWKIKGEFLYWVSLFLLVAVYLFFAVVVRGYNFSGMIFPIYFLIDIIPFGMALKIYFEKEKLPNVSIISLCFAVGIIQSLLSIAAFLNNDIQKIFLNRILNNSGIQIYNYWSTLRMYGFSHGLMFEMPAIQALLSVIALHYSSTKGWKYILLAGLLFFSAFINARTSMVIEIIGIIMLFFFNKQLVGKKIQMLIYVLVGFFFIIFIVLPFVRTRSSETYKWISQGIEDIKYFFYGGSEFGNFSYFTNSQRYVLPDTWNGLLFGEGISISGGIAREGIYSDIGFINDIWTGGLIYILFLYPSVLLRIFKLKYEDLRGKFFALLLVVLICVLNFKGRIFSMNSILNFSVLLQIFYNGGSKVDTSKRAVFT